MKWIVFINVLAAIGFMMLGAIASAIHRVHSYSMYREFVTIGAVDEQNLKTLSVPTNYPTGPHYNMPARMRQIGNAESWFSEISTLAAVACILNGTAIYFILRKRKAPEPNKSVSVDAGGCPSC